MMDEEKYKVIVEHIAKTMKKIKNLPTTAERLKKYEIFTNFVEAAALGPDNCYRSLMMSKHGDGFKNE